MHHSTYQQWHRHWIPCLLLAFMAVSCGAPQAPPSPTPARQGIISMAPHHTEVVFLLGQGDRVIGVDSYSDYPPEVAKLPKVGGYINPDLEKITMLKPALLIVGGKHQKMTEYAQLHGVAIENVHMDNVATIDTGIQRLGEVLGCVAEADALRASIHAEIEVLRADVADKPRPKVLIITGRSTHSLNSLFTAGGTSFVAEMVEMAGGDNLYQDAPEAYMEASKETVVMEAPEVIIEFHAGEKLSEEEQAAYVADWGELASLPAVKNNRIHLILESHALRPGPRMVEIARIIAGYLHGDAVNIESAHRP